jgi:CubicO group peptidase (beta-lactamase class C family)
MNSSTQRSRFLRTAGARRGFAVLTISALVPMLLAAAPPRDLTPVLKALVEKYHVAGAVGAIIHGDHLVALGSFGVRKMGDPAPFSPTDIIHLGSDTKAMTAVLIGELIDKKQLSFETKMSDIFPDLAPKMNPAMAANTVRNLLRHDGGFPHDLNWSSLPPQQRRLAVERALAAAPATPIGQFSYSNVGYVVLGAIIEAKTGKPWEQVIQRNLFAPLGMATAGFGAPGTRGRVDEPWGHILKNGALLPLQADNPPSMGPAGTVHCSIADWSKFIAEILRSARGHPTLLSERTFKELITPAPGQDYAGGWIITNRPWAGGLALTHTGSNTMWYCTAWIAPNKNFAIMIAINDGSAPAPKAADDGCGLLIKFNASLPS